jgi:hypothetical protein
LPIPNGFVKIDDSMGVLLESAKKMCPKTNTLLAFYLSEKDYVNFLSTQNCTFNDEYIIVEVFNDIKDKQVGSKDYRQFINSFKTNYIEEFKQGLNEGGKKASENLSNLDEKLKMDNINIQPFGICYESKNSISYGVLSKYTFTIENESSTDYIVAAISTVTKIDNKPIFLFAYKTYNTSDDLSSLKALNSAWIKEVDRKQSPVSFITDIDFEDYKEAILAILTLSFIWAIYFATKKIQRNMKTKNASEKREDEKDYINFDELLIDEKMPTEPAHIEPKKIQVDTQKLNPNILNEKKKGDPLWIIVGFIFAILGGVIGLFFAFNYTKKVYDKRTNIIGYIMAFTGVIAISVYKQLAK